MTTAPLILPYNGIMPKIDPSAFIAPGAVIIGDVVIGAGSSVWFGCVLRGDVNIIRIGANTNVQDGSVIHVSTGGRGTHVGDGVTIGHMALLHDCKVETNAFIGMKSCVMDRAEVQSFGMVAAGALVTPKKVVPGGQLWAGNPAKFLRALLDDDRAMIKQSAERYAALAAEYRA